MQYMDPMGVDLLHLITFPETNSLPMNISIEIQANTIKMVDFSGEIVSLQGG